MAVRVYNMTNEVVGVTAGGDHGIIQASSPNAPGFLEVPPKRAAAMVEAEPTKLTLDRQQAIGALGVFCPSFTTAHFEAMESLNADELRTVIKFLSAGRENYEKTKTNINADVLKKRVKQWMVTEQKIPELAKPEEETKNSLEEQPFKK